MTLTDKDRRLIFKLLGRYQELLEASIDAVLVDGACYDPMDAPQLRRDRRDWRAAEDLRIKLEKGGERK